MFRIKNTGFMESRNPVRYIYSVYKKPKFFIYYFRHSPKKHYPPFGVCRQYIGKHLVKKQLPISTATILYKVHYYHHNCIYKYKQFGTTISEVPPLPVYPGCAKLPAKKNIKKENKKKKKTNLDKQ